MLLVFPLLLAVSYGNVKLCLKCICYKKALIQPLYTVGCSHLGLQDTFPNLEQWPEYGQQEETRMAVNFDWNDIQHLKKFPHIPGIVSLSLQHNKITKIAGNAFVELDNLKVLDLSYNQLTGNLKTLHIVQC
ncbi:Leucine-rich repeat and fibronectin type-III domain-containing protein 4 [Zootermopsis nevadensis]|uniref:Leucine-rich repeat and fibronectin type-III domain-containing protein 4 n=1 Tax=Zootermopsis nevadensis TaxID=136037 RepID=A0A067R310_ZOONE|nr:Leucine-rich repeat and fibronectin type-III domain-containing protein 4 [Zootermopsis nevadensis]